MPKTQGISGGNLIHLSKEEYNYVLQRCVAISKKNPIPSMPVNWKESQKE